MKFLGMGDRVRKPRHSKWPHRITPSNHLLKRPTFPGSRSEREAASATSSEGVLLRTVKPRVPAEAGAHARGVVADAATRAFIVIVDAAEANLHVINACTGHAGLGGADALIEIRPLGEENRQVVHSGSDRVIRVHGGVQVRLPEQGEVGRNGEPDQ